MTIGRIISKSKVKTFDFVDITSDFDVTSNVPTLIIGKDLAKNICGNDKIHVLNRSVGDNIVWTYGKTENRNMYESSIDDFNKTIKKTIESSVKYRYFDVLTSTFRQCVNFVKYINSHEKKYFYIDGQNIYMYARKTIVGFSLNDIKYLGISLKKVIRKLTSNSSNVIIKDDTFMSYFERKYFSDNKLLYPYLYFLKQN